jgi:hypothetical protein
MSVALILAAPCSNTLSPKEDCVDSIVLVFCVAPVGFIFALVFTRWLTARGGGYRAWLKEG